jgi:uncharacterized protein YhfF/uncharacterized glyoxalase superfamily protein PhnB
VADVVASAEWLCAAFAFRVRLRIAAHRVQLAAGDGSVILTELPAGAAVGEDHAVMVRVRDLDAHHARAVAAGARIRHEPETHPYGERQYAAVDPDGHRWTFTEFAFDADPMAWGATAFDPLVDLEAWGFAEPGPLRDELTAAALAGDKTATSTLLAEFLIDRDPLPQPGDRSLLLDSRDVPVAVVETTEVRILRMADVDDQFGRDEGEGYAGHEDWRASHERYWTSYLDEIRSGLDDPTFALEDDTLVVAERFRLVERLAAHSPD